MTKTVPVPGPGPVSVSRKPGLALEPPSSLQNWDEEKLIGLLNSVDEEIRKIEGPGGVTKWQKEATLSENQKLLLRNLRFVKKTALEAIKTKKKSEKEGGEGPKLKCVNVKRNESSRGAKSQNVGDETEQGKKLVSAVERKKGDTVTRPVRPWEM
jgi:hypothetical protein